MQQLLIDFFNINRFIPHGFCLSWDPVLLWLHVISDVLITLSYYSIPLSLSYFIRKRKDLPYAWLFTMGGVFIVACGTTHLMSAILIWIPLYWLDGYIKAFTAAISVATAIAMLRIIPLALRLPTTAQLLAEQEKTNREKYKLSSILDNAPVAAYTKDLERRYQYSNRMVAELFDLPSAEIIGCIDSDFFDEASVQKIRDSDRRVIEHGSRVEIINTYRLKNGKERIFLTVKEPLIDENGSIYALSGISTDVTELKKSELAQQEVSERLHKIANQLPSLVFQFCMRADGSFCLPYASEVLRKIYRLNPADVRDDATAVFAVVHPADLSHHLETIKESARELSPWRDEYRLKFEDGTERWLWGNALPEREEDGSILWHGFVSDITERKQIELDILNTKNQLQATLNTIPDVLFELDLNGYFHDYYAHRSETFSMRAEQLLGKKISAILPPDATAICFSALQEAQQQGWSTGKEIQLELAGEIHWFELSVAVKSTENEQDPRFIVLSRNVTERKRIENKFKASEERLNLSQKYAGIGSWEADLIHDKQIWSNTVFELVKFPVIENPTWDDFLAIVHPDDRQRIIDATQNHLKNAEKYDVEYRTILADGTMRWMRSVGRAEFTSEGIPSFFRGIVQDITDRKQIELELQRSNAELEQFAYAVSHDMRQPLRMVASYLSLIESALTKQLDEETRQFLDFAIDGAKRMDAMILSLLDYSRVGRRTEPLTLISSRTAIDEALSFLKPELEASNGHVEVSGDWVDLVASRDELTRLLQNLIGNAIKYHEENKPPQIAVCATITANNFFKVTVRDSGIGINPTQIDRLFKVFSRLQARSRFDGTGVGLALCRKIVEHHNGKIGVTSKGEGQGCVFWFKLPLVNKNAMDLTP